jgi:cysteine desulfurase / selenocysteine lyase
MIKLILNSDVAMHMNTDGKIGSLRHDFPGVEKWGYFDVAARGLLPRSSRAAVEAYFDTLMHDGGDKAAMFRVVESARSRFATLIGAKPDEIAITKNVSEGLNIIANAYPWRTGDKVILCADREHPNNIYIWLQLARRFGIEVCIVPSRDGHIVAGDLIAAFDDRTRIVTVSSVSFHPGLRTDVEALAEACTARDILLLVDGVQSVGVTHLDVGRSRIDALAVSTQKGLLGLYGMGFLYCRREWAERLQPVYLARFGVDLGDAHEAAGGVSDYNLMPAARRFDLGNYNFAGATAVDRSLELLLSVGTEAIERHVRDLTKALVDGLVAFGLPVVGAPFGPHFTNIVTVSERTDDETFNARLEAVLAENRFKISIRRNALRFSSHLYNTHEEIERVLDVIGRFLRVNSRVTSAVGQS